MAGLIPAYYTDPSQVTVYRTGDINISNSCVNWKSAYRLPTEAEWEKAARGGLSGQRFPWGNTIRESQANYYAYPNPPHSGGYTYDLEPYTGYNTNFDTGGYPYTSPVGYFPPNGYGLYDMAGNAWQWCWDWHGAYGGTSQVDPHGFNTPNSAFQRIARGCSWTDDASHCRSEFRGGNVPNCVMDDVKFRSVLPLGQ